MPKTVEKNTDIYTVHEVDQKNKIVWILVKPRNLLVPCKRTEKNTIKSGRKRFLHNKDRFYGKRSTYLPPNMYSEVIRLAAGVINDRFKSKSPQ